MMSFMDHSSQRIHDREDIVGHRNLSAIAQKSRSFLGYKAIHLVQLVFQEHRRQRAVVKLEQQSLALVRTNEYRIQGEAQLVDSLGYHIELPRDQHQLRAEESLFTRPQDKEFAIRNPTLQQRSHVVGDHPE